MSYTRKPEEVADFYKEAIRRISELPGVEQVALGTVVPWRDPGFFAAQFTAEGYRKANGEEDPRAQFRTVSPGFFSALGVRLIAGRDFNDSDRRDGERVVIVSQSLAQRMFPSMDAVNRRVMWTDPVTKFIGVSTDPRRIVGIVPDVDDENVVPKPDDDRVSPDGAGDARRPPLRAREDGSVCAGADRSRRSFAISRRISRWSAPATLDDVRAEVLTPNRINALVFSGFAGVALAIAVVGVAGVLAFSVSARTREFGVRLAIGSTPVALLARVVREGAVIGVGRHRRRSRRRRGAHARCQQLYHRDRNARGGANSRRGRGAGSRGDPGIARPCGESVACGCDQRIARGLTGCGACFARAPKPRRRRSALRRGPERAALRESDRATADAAPVPA